MVAMRLLERTVMAHVVAVYGDWPLRSSDGRIYTAQACGREREDGIWEGWLEFLTHDGSEVLRSERETTQPTFADLGRWASGIRPVYLEGALERILTPPPVIVDSPLTEPVYDEPAPPKQPMTVPAPETAPVLNPFSVYAKGEALLRQQLAPLPSWELRAIIVAYDFADPAHIDLDALTNTELIDLIVGAVRTRFAA
jgi:hypothetical protein